MAVRSEGIILERPDDAVEAAVDGLWLLYADIWASDRAASVRPWHTVRRVAAKLGRRDSLTDIYGGTRAFQFFDRAPERHPNVLHIVSHLTEKYTARPCHSPVASEKCQLEAFQCVENDVAIREARSAWSRRDYLPP
jgi:hypothetical protein